MFLMNSENRNLQLKSLKWEFWIGLDRITDAKPSAIKSPQSGSLK